MPFKLQQHAIGRFGRSESSGFESWQSLVSVVKRVKKCELQHEQTTRRQKWTGCGNSGAMLDAKIVHTVRRVYTYEGTGVERIRRKERNREMRLGRNKKPRASRKQN